MPGHFTLSSAPLFLRLTILSAFALQAVSGALPSTAAAEEWQSGGYRDFVPAAVRGLPGTSPLKLSRTAVQRPRVTAGDSVDLIAEYQVAAPAGTMMVKETRIVSFNGQQLDRKERVISVPNGSKGSTLALRVPASAAPGWYTVKTTVEPQVVAGTRGVSSPAAPAIDRTGFNVEERGLQPPSPGPSKTAPAPPPSPVVPKPPTPSASAPLQMKLWADKTEYKVGDKMVISFEAPRDGYVTLVNVGTSGRITILYPNGFAPDHAVKGGRAYSVPAATSEPYDLTLSGPPGAELVYAVFMTSPIRFSEANFAKSSFTVVNDNAEQFTRDINVALKTIPLKEQANATLELDVKP